MSHQLFNKSTGLVLLTNTLDVVSREYATRGFPADLGIRETPAAPLATTDSGAGVVFSDKRRNADGTVTGRVEDYVSEHAKQRVARHEQLLRTLGIALPPPVYAPGTTVNTTGEDNFRTSRLDWEEQAPVIDGLVGVQDTVRAEDRRDLDVPLRGLRLTNEGWLTRGRDPLALEEGGFRQLLGAMGSLFPRALPVLLKAPLDIRVPFFNDMMARFEDDELHKLVPTACPEGQDPATFVPEYVKVPSEVKLRTRTFNGVRQVYAVTSTSYGVRDADAIAADIIAGLKGAAEDARGTVVYDPETTNLRVNATWHANRVVDFAAGDVFQLGASYSSNDARGGSILVDATAWRNRCRNLIIIGEASTNLLRKRHRGSMSSVAAEVTAKTALVVDLFNSFADDWGTLRATPVQSVLLWGEKFASVPDALEWAVKNKKLDVGVRAAVLTEALLGGWQVDQGETLADLINAVTAVHTLASINEWQREAAERAAGELVPVLLKAAS
jgi:hypothetical protein